MIEPERPKALQPYETKATEAPPNNLPCRLHKAADVPFHFPQFLREGLSLPAVPFSVTHCGMLPETSSRDIDRYHFLFRSALTRDYWIAICKSTFLVPFLGSIAMSTKAYNYLAFVYLGTLYDNGTWIFSGTRTDPRYVNFTDGSVPPQMEN